MFRLSFFTATVLIAVLFTVSTTIFMLSLTVPGIFAIVMSIVSLSSILLAVFMGISLFECYQAIQYHKRRTETHEQHYHNF